MSLNLWSTAFSLYNSTKFKQLLLLTLRELRSMLIVLGLSTAVMMVNAFFLRFPYATAIVTAAMIWYAVLTTRSSAGLKNARYYFRYSWLLIPGLLGSLLGNFALKFSSLGMSFVILLTIFLLLSIADICAVTEIFKALIRCLKILISGIPFLLPIFVCFALFIIGTFYIPYFLILLPLALCLLVVWCANWYIIALYDKQ